MGTGKPKWRKPKLLVLVRGKKSEVVLQTCKAGSILMGPGVTEWWMGCRTEVPPDWVCHAYVMT